MQLRLSIIALAIALSACVPKSELDAAQQRISQLQAENSQLKVQLERKPDLPLSLAVRKALTGPGYVAVFETTVKEPVAALATLTSKALGTAKKFEVRVSPTVPYELGHLEGAVIEAGDTLVLENQNYSPRSFTIKAQ